MTQKLNCILSAIVAYDKNFAIGKDNQLLWHLPNDLKHFKNLTLNKKILMGRKTYESIGRPLPNRQMIVLTRNQDFHSDYAQVIHDLSELNQLASPHEEVMIIGGAEIYNLCLPYTQKIYATEVDAKITADAFFPRLNPEEWLRTDIEQHRNDATHNCPYTFVTLIKKA